MDYQAFLGQCAKVSSTEVRTIVYPNAKWKESGEIGVYIYSHFVGVDSDSGDYFVTGNEVREIKGNVSDFVIFG